MSDNISTILDNMTLYLNNPALIQRDLFSHLSKVTSGKVNIVDATNPFVFNMEAVTVCIAGFMAQDVAENRKQYAFAAQLPDELYLHMSDKDYLGRFAKPSTAKAIFFFDKAEIINRMVEDPATGMKKLVIPRNTYITISEVTFSMQYPIEIRMPSHGGLQIVYINDKPSPLMALKTNVIEAVEAKSNGIDLLCFTVDLMQFSIQSLEVAPSPGAAFSVDMDVIDRFCYARVYVQNTNRTWTEIRTTHTDQVYDIAVPTAVLRLSGSNLLVRIPQIYMTSGGATKIRIDIYQTKGELNMDLGAYPTDATVITWFAIDKNDVTVFSTPLDSLRFVSVASDSRTQGGSGSMPFPELRQKVIDGATGDQVVPITNVSLASDIEDAGFSLVTNIDNVTNRALLATRAMPKPTDPNLITEAGASIEMISVSITSALTNKPVIDNGANVTITPETLYQSKNGVMSIVSDSKMAAINALTPELKALELTTGSYYYSPFHYVLDSSGLEFESRPYYLDKPTVETSAFISENDTTLLRVSTAGYVFTKNTAVTRDRMGYRLRITTSSSESFKALEDDQVFVQLAYIPPGESDRAYLNGTFAGKDPTTEERYFDFDLGTTFDVNSDHRIILNKFMMYVQEPHQSPTELTTTFDILYATNAVMSDKWTPKAVDKVLGNFLLPPQIYGITNDTITLRFGDSLKTLWAQARSVIAEMSWKRHETDKVRTYPEDVYKTDPVTGATMSVVNGELVYEILHRAGDTVLKSNGEVAYDYRIGDIVYDSFGNPVPSNPRGMEHQIDIFMIEGVYKFATEPSAVTYREELVDTVVSWVVDGLTDVREKLLEQTRLFFFPKATLGQIEVFTTDGFITSIEAAQALKVKLTVPLSVKKNKALLKNLSRTTTAIVSEYFDKETIAISEIERALKESYGDDVINVELSGLGGNKNYQVVSVVDTAKRCSIRKRLVALPDDSLIIEEDITIDPTSLRK